MSKLAERQALPNLAQSSGYPSGNSDLIYEESISEL